MDREYTVQLANPYLDEEDARAVYEVVKSGRLSQGPKVEEFEKKFANYIGVKHAVAVFNGTVALHLSLAAMGIGPGDEVIVPSFSFASTANVAIYQNAKPVFCDIKLDTYNLDPDGIESQVTTKTKTIIPVHYAGQTVDMAPITEIAEKYDLTVVEDAAEAHGSTYRGEKAGALGDTGCFSFYPNKNMTTGEGGIITTDNDELAERMRIMRTHGQDRRYHHVLLGYNYRMTELQAALGIVQLNRLDESVEGRIEIARLYSEKLSSIQGVVAPFVRPENRHTYMLYTVRVPNRDKVRAYLEESGVETRIAFPPIHLQPLYRELYGYKGGELPVTEEAASSVLSIPMYYGLEEEKQDFVVNHLRKAMGSS
jgi:dTDP-4-amino-4,6-dideoxygalactose transaminase